MTIPLVLTVALMGCATETQTSSGRDYLAKYRDVPISAPADAGFGAKNIDQMVRDAAAVEPVLKFPARIGLARLDDGRLAAIPPEEALAWQKAREKLGDGFGEFVPLSPMVVGMVTSAIRDQQGYFERYIEGVIAEIRFGAARQHLDAVLIYEEHSKQETHDNLLALGKLTIVGGFILPSESHDAQGFAEGMLIDVVQGYPYGTIQTVVDKQSSLESAWGWGSSRSTDEALADRVKTQAGVQLADEGVGMFTKLRTQLAEMRAK
jgi:hypothetical protein